MVAGFFTVVVPTSQTIQRYNPENGKQNIHLTVWHLEMIAMCMDTFLHENSSLYAFH
jgi:hypothetical protein